MKINIKKVCNEIPYSYGFTSSMQKIYKVLIKWKLNSLLSNHDIATAKFPSWYVNSC